MIHRCENVRGRGWSRLAHSVTEKYWISSIISQKSKFIDKASRIFLQNTAKIFDFSSCHKFMYSYCIHIFTMNCVFFSFSKSEESLLDLWVNLLFFKSLLNGGAGKNLSTATRYDVGGGRKGRYVLDPLMVP